MSFRVLVFLILIMAKSHAAQFVCMESYNANNYDCRSDKNPESLNFCQNVFGEDFKSYIKSDQCTEEEAAQLRGEEEEIVPEEAIQSPCYKFETGIKRGCEVWHYSPAFNFCSSIHGSQFVPFQPSSECSYEDSMKARGFESSERLNLGLKIKFKELNSLLTLIDRRGSLEDFQKLSTTRPVKNFDFYGEPMKEVLARIIDINKELEERSLLKVPFIVNDTNIQNYIKYLFEYFRLTSRIYRLYAFHAHQNFHYIDSFNFEKLSFLGLELTKDYALEVLSKVAFKGTTLDDKRISINYTKATLQVFEYEALSEPVTELEYVKLLKFLGIRESLINAWAINNVQGSPSFTQDFQNSCKGYLSLNHDNKEESITSESTRYDHYLRLMSIGIETIAEKVTPFDFSAKFIKEVNSEIKQKVLKRNVKIGLEYSDDEIIDIVSSLNDDNLLIDELKISLLVGDDIHNLEFVIKTFSDTIIEHKRKILRSSFLELYNTIPHSDLLKVERVVEAAYNNYYVSDHSTSLFKVLSENLQLLFNEKTLLINKQEKFFEKNLRLAKMYARDADDLKKIEANRNVNARPRSYQETESIINSKLRDEYKDVLYTIQKNTKFSKMYKGIVSKLAEYKILDENQGFPEIEKNYNEHLIKTLEQITMPKIEENISNKTALAPKLFEIKEENSKLTPYQILVYENGEPIVLHLNTLYLSLLEPFFVKTPYKAITMRLSPLWGGYDPKNLATQNIDKGSIEEFIGTQKKLKQSDILTLFKDSIDTTRYYLNKHIDETHYNDETKKELIVDEYGDGVILKTFSYLGDVFSGIGHDKAVMNIYQKAKSNFESTIDDKIIKDENYFIYRVFRLFSMVSPIKGSLETKSTILYTFSEKKTLLKNRLEYVYGLSPILRIKIFEKSPSLTFINAPHAVGHTLYQPIKVEKKISLLRQIARHGYNNKTNEVNVNIAKNLIQKTLSTSKDNIKKNLPILCELDLDDYKNDKNWGDVFTSSSIIRKSLQTTLGRSEFQVNKIKELDEGLRRKLRGKLEAVNEDYIEPNLLIIGGVTLLALAIVGTAFSFGSLGATIPGALSYMAAISGAALTSKVVNSFLLAVFLTSTTARLNTTLFEVPKQLEFTESIISSQVGGGEISSYKDLAKIKNENQNILGWTLAFLPLDILFGKAVFEQVKSSLGFSGVSAFKRLTGVRLSTYNKNYSIRKINNAPFIKRKVVSYKALKALVLKGTEKTRNLIPKYQNISKALISEGTLRVAISDLLKKQSSNHIHPSMVMNGVKQKAEEFVQRFKNYRIYSAEEKQFIEKLVLRDGLTWREYLEHGVVHSSFIIRLKSEFAAIKSGRYTEYIAENGDLIEKIKKIQTQVLNRQYELTQSLLVKVRELDTLYLGTKLEGNQSIDIFVKNLSSDELVLIEKFANLSKGDSKNLTQIFIDYKEMIKLRPIEGFNISPDNPYLSHNREIAKNYSHISEEKDILKFYESLLYQMKGIKKDHLDYKLIAEIDAELKMMTRTWND